MFNIAITLDRMRRYPEAIEAYRTALRMSIDAERRQAIEDRLPVLVARDSASRVAAGR